MWRLGFDFVLARDMTDAYTTFDKNKPDEVNPDRGTVLTTSFIESHGLTLTTEFWLIAMQQKTWSVGQDPCLIVPWGTAVSPTLGSA